MSDTADAHLRANGLEIPAAHRIVSLAERPDLIDPSDHFNGSAWPPFMLESPVANGLFGRCFTDWPQFQFVLLGQGDRIAGTSNAMPLAWDGTDDGLPTGWEDQVIRSVADHDVGRAPNALGAMQIVVDPRIQGSGFSGTMIGAMRAAARGAGYRAVIACVRPTWKERYPLIPIDRYARWTRDDGLPFDPWIRLHVRLGAEILKPVPRSLHITGTVAEWEQWVELALPETGTYVFPHGLAPLEVDRGADRCEYWEPNVWVRHRLG